MILAIDIGGTKFSMAVFDGERMVRRESRATDAAGGRDWMLQQIAGICAEWRQDLRFERCGIGFGGPVNFAAQRVMLSTHVGGWRDFDLPGFVGEAAGAPCVMDNDANVGAIGRGRIRRGQGLLAAVLHDPLHGHRRRHLPRGPRLAGRGFLRRRDRTPHHSSRWPRVPLRRARLLRAHVLRALAGARSWQDRPGTDGGRRLRGSATWWTWRWG